MNRPFLLKKNITETLVGKALFNIEKAHGCRISSGPYLPAGCKL